MAWPVAVAAFAGSAVCASASAAANASLAQAAAALRGGAGGGASCAVLGCRAFAWNWGGCQCNGVCQTFGNCCRDYEDVCAVRPTKLEVVAEVATLPGHEPGPARALAGPREGVVPSAPPPTALAYRGMAWPDMVVAGSGEMHFFAIGDWGGMDGSLPPTGGRARMIAYKGGHTSGPHVFPRTRWNKGHSELLCNHKEFVECYDSDGATCPAGCGFVKGVDTQPQHLVAAAFRTRAAEKDPKFIVNVGDNFYWGGLEIDCGSSMAGISSVARHQFNQIFEGIYQGAGLSGKPWLSVLGNHDWGGRVFNNGWDQQIAYTWASNRWVMPAPYFSQHIEFPDLGFSVDILMTDSNAMDAKDPAEDPEHNMCSRLHNPVGADCSAADGPASVDHCQQWFWDLYREQKPWVEKKLAASKADWQIINTHFPCGHDGGWYRDLHSRFGLDLLITGHRHDQEMQVPSYPLGGMACLITGGGGGISSEASPEDHTHWYGEAQYGFYDLTISKQKIFIESINHDGKVVKSATVYPK